MKRVAIFILLLAVSIVSFSQNIQQKKILYLVPFFTDRIVDLNLAAIENDDQLDNQLPFQLVGFWNGSKIALQEFSNDSIHIQLIVRDITDNESKLRTIMSDEEFMSDIDLIIGPFYSNIFLIAAEYAKKFEIPIVNPFSNRQDILLDNEYVYKATPPFSVAPQHFYDLMIEKDRDANIILWYDDEQDAVYKGYDELFRRQELEPKKLLLDADVTQFLSSLKSFRQNVVIMQSNSAATVINNLRTLYAMENLQDFTLLIPEKWFSELYSESEIFNAMNAHYFSNYYVDYQSEKTIYFISEYVEYYSAPPTLEHFAFQGYDITAYFLQALVHNFDHSKISQSPLAMKFNFIKTKNGGWENQKLRLLMLNDYTITEIGE